MSLPTPSAHVAVIGGGPAGLMAAEVISAAGYSVAVYDAMPSVGRKFLLAGVGGMNITHAEDTVSFLTRYGQHQPMVAPWLEKFSAEALREWVHGLGVETFVGSSGRVFPKEMKAAPLLRAWLHRLRGAGVKFYPRHRWQGWNESGQLCFNVANTDEGEQEVAVSAGAVVLAVGGASWSRLGSDGAWVPLLRQQSVSIANLQPANCGFTVNWSDYFKQHYAGEPLKGIIYRLVDHNHQRHCQHGEAVVTGRGIEGGAIYGLSAALRDTIVQQGKVRLTLDLLPDQSHEAIVEVLLRPRGKNSLSNFLRKSLRLSRVKVALLRESLAPEVMQQPEQLAVAIKALSITLTAPHPIDEAISSAGGVRVEALTPSLMLQALPGVFCAGEMLDWEAPTGGYLLSACFASGWVAGEGVVSWLERQPQTA